MKKEIKLDKINRLLHIDGNTVKAREIIDRAAKETLVNVVAYVIDCLENNSTPKIKL